MALIVSPAPGAPAQSAWLAALLPAGIATAELPGAADPALLLASERALLGGAVPARAGDFAAGRVCARCAAARFGLGEMPIGVHADRRPRWPTPLTGSITHTAGFTAAAVGERRYFRAIGIDAERVGAVSADLWRHVFRPAETAWLAGLPPAAQDEAGTLMFSAKEAFFKCQYEATGQWLEFCDVVVECRDRTLDRDGLSVRPAARGTRFEGYGEGQAAIVRFAVQGGLVLTAMALAAH